MKNCKAWKRTCVGSAAIKRVSSLGSLAALYVFRVPFPSSKIFFHAVDDKMEINKNRIGKLVSELSTS